MKKKKQSKKKDFLDVMYETEKKFKKLLTDIYKIHNSGWVQKREIHYLIEDIKDIKENLITAEVIKYGRQWHFKELKENLWKWISCKNATVAKMQQPIFRIKKCLTQDIVRDILRTKFSWPIIRYPIVS